MLTLAALEWNFCTTSYISQVSRPTPLVLNALYALLKTYFMKECPKFDDSFQDQKFETVAPAAAITVKPSISGTHFFDLQSIFMVVGFPLTFN